MPLYNRALAIQEKAFGPDSLNVVNSVSKLAVLYEDLGQYAQAESLYKRTLMIREKALGPEHPHVAESLDYLAEFYRDRGLHAQAEPFYKRVVAIREKTLGPKHRQVARSLIVLASVLVKLQKPVLARPLYERARRIYLEEARADNSLLEEGERIQREYIDLLAGIARDPQLDPSPVPASSDAFIVVEQVHNKSAAMALAQAGARAAAGEPALRAHELQIQTDEAWKKLINEFVREFEKPAEQQPDVGQLSSLEHGMRQVEREMVEAREQLLKRFPRYAELASPEPIEAGAVQQLLRGEEALISYFTLDDRSLVWLVRPGKGLIYKDIEIKKADLTKMVAKVRMSLDQSTNPDLATGALTPYDVSGAHELFKLLITPLRDHLAGVKHVMIVPVEVLLPLPFGTLITRAEGEAYKMLAELYAKRLRPSPAELADYSKLSWLAKDYAITVLPSATSLRALRQIARPKSPDVEPLIAFGDPVLQGRGRVRGGEMLASRGVRVALDEIRILNRLPGTRDELLAMARALGAEPSKALYLDEKATKPVVFNLNNSGHLSRAQVISFATHGLIGGELKGLKEPALVLTPPDQPSEQDNGLLGLEDILSLKLNNADWVILSACNTAAPEGSGEGLSGLVRAFFFAGAPSLLVSHWSVEDRATQALMTEVFQRYARDKTMARSEALRQGTLALMDKAKGQMAYFAHPFAWAPFFLVGEGRN